MPCNRLNQSKSWVLNAFLPWDLHNWHINMHKINWKWQNRVGKMFMSVKIKAVAKRTPEHALSLGWWPHLTLPRNRQGSSWPPHVMAVSCQWYMGLAQLRLLAGLTWAHYLFFLLYIYIPQFQRGPRLMDILLTGLLASHDTSLRNLTITNDVCRDRGQKKEKKKRDTDWVISPMQIKERIL